LGQKGRSGEVKITAVLCVKNEGAFLLEWLAHHRAVGITDFLVFSNDCEDGTDRMLDRLQALGWLVHVPNPGPFRGGPQWAALRCADRHPVVTSADWLITFDIDEFINVRVGDHTLSALLAALPEATAIPLTWRLFGNAGVMRFADVPITETFLRAAPVPLHWPWRAMMFKTLFRNDGTYRKLGVHRPRSPDPNRLSAQRWYDGSGREMPAVYRSQRIFSDPGTTPFGLVQMNHYALGAAESFVLKCHRGRPNRETTAMGMDYWVDRNFNDEEDKSILGLSSAAGRQALHADPPLDALHREALIWRQERFRTLMAEEPWRALYGRLLLAPSSRVMGPDEAAAIWTVQRESGLVPG
jgi:Glycosyl transferase family 2